MWPRNATQSLAFVLETSGVMPKSQHIIGVLFDALPKKLFHFLKTCSFFGSSFATEPKFGT